MGQEYKKLADGSFEITTARLLLRAARDEDAQALNAAFKDPEVMKYWSDAPRGHGEAP